MMANKMKLADYLRSIGHNSFTAEQQIRQLTGVHVSRALLDDLVDERGHRKSDGKPFIIAKPKAEALCRWLSDEMGRDIGIHDLADALEVC